MAQHNGFFGVKDAHIAILTDETELTYETPKAFLGVVEIKADAQTSTEPAYADNSIWLEETVDNGFTGEIHLYDWETDPESRELYSRITGYGLAADGRVIGISNRTPEPFALMSTQPGKHVSKRRCYYHCELGKPSMDAKTNEGSPQITELTYPFTAIPVKLPSGVDATFYDDYSNNETYGDFFKKVDTSIVEGTYTPDGGDNTEPGSGD